MTILGCKDLSSHNSYLTSAVTKLGPTVFNKNVSGLQSFRKKYIFWLIYKSIISEMEDFRGFEMEFQLQL